MDRLVDPSSDRHSWPTTTAVYARSGERCHPAPDHRESADPYRLAPRFDRCPRHPPRPSSARALARDHAGAGLGAARPEHALPSPLGWLEGKTGFDELVEHEFRPTLAALQEEALAEGWLETLIAYGYFPAASAGDELVVFDPAAPDQEAFRLAFPRQPDRRLCLADYYQPLESPSAIWSPSRSSAPAVAPARSPRRSNWPATTPKATSCVAWPPSTAEALADVAQDAIRHELGLPPDQGKRFSWGYGACPDLEQQHPVLHLLDAQRLIGVTLTEGHQLDPEHSTAAIVVLHPEASYFAVRAD